MHAMLLKSAGTRTASSSSNKEFVEKDERSTADYSSAHGGHGGQEEDEVLFPSLPGQKVHHCTDCAWVLLFLIASGGLVFISLYAHANGDDFDRLDRMSKKFQNHTDIEDLSNLKVLIVHGSDAIFDLWYDIPLAGLFAMFLGLVYFQFLHACVEVIMRVVALFVVLVPIMFGAALIYREVAGQAQSRYELYVGCGFIAVSFVTGSLVKQFSGAMEGAASLIKASTECIIEHPSLQVEPFVVMVFRMVSFVVALATMGKLILCLPKITENNLDEPLPENIKLMIGYVIFMTWWINSFAVALSEYVITFVAQRWYFTPYVNGRKLDKSRRAHFEGYKSALTSHVGSLLCGSFLIPLLWLPRSVLWLVQPSASDSNSCSKCMGSCCCLCIRLYDSIFKPICKQAYIQIANESEPFCTAGRGYCKVERSMRSTGSVQKELLAAQGMQEMFMLGGLLLITWASSVLTLLTTEAYNTQVLGIHTRPEPTILMGGFISFSVAVGNIVLFLMISDTMMYCWMLQEMRYQAHQVIPQSPGKTQAASSYMGWMLAEGPRTPEGRVHYAPPALRDYLTKTRSQADPRRVSLQGR